MLFQITHYHSLQVWLCSFSENDCRFSQKLLYSLFNQLCVCVSNWSPHATAVTRRQITQTHKSAWCSFTRLINIPERSHTDNSNTHTHPDPSEYSWRRYPAGLFEMEPHRELKATSRAIFLPIALVALLGRAVSGHYLRIVCSSWPRQRKMGMSTDKHGCIIRAAVMCHPLCASRQTVGDLEEAGIPSRLSGKSG